MTTNGIVDGLSAYKKVNKDTQKKLDSFWDRYNKKKKKKDER